MFRKIMFSLGKETLELSDVSFPLGEFSAQVLNLSPAMFHPIQDLLTQAKAKMQAYEEKKDTQHFQDSLNLLREVDRALCGYEALALLKQGPDMLSVAEEALHRLTHPEYYIAEENSEDVLDDGAENPDEAEEEYPSDQEILEALLPRDIPSCWKLCQLVVEQYTDVMNDLAAFNQTIQFFSTHFLSTLKKMDTSNYAAALCDYFNHDRFQEKVIAGPLNGNRIYTNADPVILSFIPRPIYEGAEEYEIFELYEAENLQTLLKMDFYRGLKIGHVVRRCAYCRRYFLLTKGYHTKYCDKPNPDDPKYTCAQLGYRQTGQKEKAEDDPLKRSLQRCYQRLNKDVSRGRLTSQERDVLYAKAQDLHFEVRRDPEISFERFDKLLATQALCGLCGIQRQNGKAGRPKNDQ